MNFTLSTGEDLHIGDAITLTVLAIEGDLIRFALEVTGAMSPGTDDGSEGIVEDGLKYGRIGWEFN